MSPSLDRDDPKRGYGYRYTGGMTKRCPGYKGIRYSQSAHDVPNDAEHFYAGKSKCRVCYDAYAADWRAERSVDGDRGRPRLSTANRGLPPVLDGVHDLATLIKQAGYSSVVAAIARHTVFLHPDTVAQTNGAALFPVVRDRDMTRRGHLDVLPGGRAVLLDDNTSPTLAFLWAAGRTKGPDVQFSHVWDRSRDPDAYTALWNLCATPAFLAKTTDGSNHPEVRQALQFHAYGLYGCLPKGQAAPEQPDGYERLTWAPHPAPVVTLEEVIRGRLRGSPKSRPAIACQKAGWLFSGWQPDSTL